MRGGGGLWVCFFFLGGGVVCFFFGGDGGILYLWHHLELCPDTKFVTGVVMVPHIQQCMKGEFSYCTITIRYYHSPELPTLQLKGSHVKCAYKVQCTIAHTCNVAHV